jgi:hypothetical protein
VAWPEDSRYGENGYRKADSLGACTQGSSEQSQNGRACQKPDRAQAVKGAGKTIGGHGTGGIRFQSGRISPAHFTFLRGSSYRALSRRKISWSAISSESIPPSHQTEQSRVQDRLSFTRNLSVAW